MYGGDVALRQITFATYYYHGHWWDLTQLVVPMINWLVK